MRNLCLLALLAGVLAAAAELTATKAQPAGGDWATIKGQVTFTKAPMPGPVNVTNDKEHCLSKGPLVYEEVIVDGKTKGFKNVVVYLRPDDPNRKALFPQEKIHPKLAKAAPKNHVIDQPCCQFVPRITAAREGDTLEVKNSAPVAHNVNMTGDDPNLQFNITIPSGKSHKPAAPLAYQFTPIPFKCDIHPWMAGKIRVFDHPYFAVTDADGNFEIKSPPAGKYKIWYWSDTGWKGGEKGANGEPVEIKDGVTDLGKVTWPGK